MVLAPIALKQATSSLCNVSVIAKFVVAGAFTVVVVLRVVLLICELRVDRVHFRHGVPPIEYSVSISTLRHGIAVV